MPERVKGSSSSALMARPKSPSLNFSAAVRKMFSGLMSLRTRPIRMLPAAGSTRFSQSLFPLQQ